MKKYALVLSGGGFKGAFQVGALEYILENKEQLKVDGKSLSLNQFDIITGVSVGSLNGAILAVDNLPLLQKLWFEDIANNGTDIIYTSDFVDNGKLKLGKASDKLLPKLGLMRLLGLIFSKKSRNKLVGQVLNNASDIRALADNTPLKDTLKKHISRDAFRRDVKYVMGYVSLEDGLYYSHNWDEFDNDDELIKAIWASTTMPIVWEPVDEISFRDKDGNLKKVKENVDGGIRDITPLGDAVKLINEDNTPDTSYHVIVINCSTPEVDRKTGKLSLASIAERSLLDIALGEILQNDIDQFVRINNILKACDKTELKVVTPDGDRT